MCVRVGVQSGAQLWKPLHDLHCLLPSSLILQAVFVFCFMSQFILTRFPAAFNGDTAVSSYGHKAISSVSFVYYSSVPLMVPKTTAETLKHKINPSAGETFPQAVEVLLYTPGMEYRITEERG